MSQDIKEQILDQVRASPVFAIQCDETTDIAQCCQLLMYARFVSGTHCILREALASRTTPAEMRDVLNVAIKIVNFIKAGALNSRLFTLLCKDMESEHEALLFHTNGKNINIIMHHDIIRTFLAKLDLWKSRVQNGNTACFSNLDSALSNKHLDPEFKKQIITHLTDVKAEFIKYFPDIDEKREAWKFIRNPFHCDVADISEEVQDEFLELNFNSITEEDFKESDLETFWIKYLPVYPLTSRQALQILCLDPRIFVKRHFPYSLLSKPSTETG
ncbi:zinc finger BED domain-containing protein 5-like [Macrobrachium rosenbergii]|uniref:zinc finger BED domain-containing protein 5-like n=1 Tax=Macrobrachium rosenbergii TaxID=79674 RepID=UPI0034D3A653